MKDVSDIRASHTDDHVFGVQVNVPSLAWLLTRVGQHFVSGDGFSIATLNLDHVVKLRQEQAFKRAYERHSYVTADGKPIVWMAGVSGQPVELVPGSELIDPLIQCAVEHGVSVAFFGSSQSVLDAAAETLVAKYPGLVVSATISPPMGFDPEGAQADHFMQEIARSEARLCFLALGAPKQEIFAARAQDHLTSVGFVSIGAGLDFIAGEQVRAPAIMRKLALEWLWRLVHNPSRLALRYAACFKVLPFVFKDALAVRLRSKSET